MPAEELRPSSSTVAGIDAMSTSPLTTKSRWTMDCHVNRQLLPLKFNYFLFYGALAGVVIPINIYCRQLGMSLSMVGVLFGLLPFVQLISKLLAGSIADKLVKHKTVLLINLTLLLVSLFSPKFMPKAALPSLASVGRVKWTPEDVATVECFPDGPIQVKACDYLHDNDSTLGLRLLAPATVGCNLTCGTSEFEHIQHLFCTDEHPDCLLRKKYSFYDADHVNLMVEVQPPKGKMKLTPYGSQADLFCVTLAVTNMTITDIVFPSLYLDIATTAACPSNVHSVFSCPVVCTTTYIADQINDDIHRPDMTLQFTWIWLACIIGWANYGAAIMLFDTILLMSLGEENRGDYGKTRLFTSVGWGSMSLISAYLIDLASRDKAETDITPGFYVFGVFTLINIGVTATIKPPVFVQPEKLVRNVLTRFKSFEVIVFATAIFLSGVNIGFKWTFLVVYAKELVNGSQLVIGISYAVESLLSEVPFFYISGWILKRIGHSRAMSFVLLVGGLKCLIYSFLTNAWYLCCVALIHGVTYGLLYSTLASFASRIAPEGAAATLQGIFQAIFEGIGVGSGSIIGGLAYDHFGGRETFRLFGLVWLGIGVVHFLVNYIWSIVTHNRQDSGSAPVFDQQL